MISQLEALEKISRLLEPVAGKRDVVRKKVIDYSENFINHIETLKAFEVNDENGAGLLSFPVSEEPIDIELALAILKSQVDHTGLNPASGGHLGYIPGGGIYYAALGDYLADVFNRYAGVYFASPGAVRMENLLIQWMSGLMGYPQNAIGNLTSGGSIANLMGIVCARDASMIKARDFEKAVIYITSQVHHSIEKAIRIAGLKECIIRHVPLDERYRMKADDLERMIVLDKTNRLLPFLVVASAGTTDTGAIDPLDDIGNIAKKHELWYHIDGAYGGFFMLTAEGKEKLKGIEQSDTLVIDPHKSLFLPYGSGVLLAKDPRQLNASHFYFANYMQDTLQATEEVSPADVSPELTKHFRGLRLWLPLKLLGLKPFRACLEEKLLLAKYFYEEVQKLGFEVGAAPQLSVVTYRYIPETGDADAFNKQLVEAVQKDGRVFISSTILDGKFTLRAAIVSFRTHLSTIDLLLAVLKEKVQLLNKQ
ncbi:MAG: aminotransferase class V-fold PLP-dependent enzyme [Chitinophagaceae bacterium]|nr:aminotransferase class V-fold PLP-dependent enzyme [Chitinophagaceae bacterium]